MAALPVPCRDCAAVAQKGAAAAQGMGGCAAMYGAAAAAIVTIVLVREGTPGDAPSEASMLVGGPRRQSTTAAEAGVHRVVGVTMVRAAVAIAASRPRHLSCWGGACKLLPYYARAHGVVSGMEDEGRV